MAETQTETPLYEGEARRQLTSPEAWGLAKVIGNSPEAWAPIGLREIADEETGDGFLNIYSVRGDTVVMLYQIHIEGGISTIRFIPLGSDARAREKEFFAIAERLNYREEGESQ